MEDGTFRRHRHRPQSYGAFLIKSACARTLPLPISVFQRPPRAPVGVLHGASANRNFAFSLGLLGRWMWLSCGFCQPCLIYSQIPAAFIKKSPLRRLPKPTCLPWAGYAVVYSARSISPRRERGPRETFNGKSAPMRSLLVIPYQHKLDPSSVKVPSVCLALAYVLYIIVPPLPPLRTFPRNLSICCFGCYRVLPGPRQLYPCLEVPISSPQCPNNAMD